MVQFRYHYIYTVCIVIEANFRHETLENNLSILQTSLTCLFSCDCYPYQFSDVFNFFLNKQKYSIKFKNGTHNFQPQIISVQIIDQSKIPFTEEENNRAQKEGIDLQRKLNLILNSHR